ncbi:hypothetical protein GJ496_005607 [Pomphorhynchus laevis]|nr:hypothetical protein GJ496_005607 [Pomphorhynchus laevis]
MTCPPGMSICPYDSSHIVNDLRYPAHVIKCRKNHPEIELVSCFYNARHLVPQRKLHEHHLNCRSRSEFNKNKYIENISFDKAPDNSKNYTPTSLPWDDPEAKQKVRSIGRGALRFTLFAMQGRRTELNRQQQVSTNRQQLDDSGISDVSDDGE